MRSPEQLNELTLPSSAPVLHHFHRRGPQAAARAEEFADRCTWVDELCDAPVFRPSAQQVGGRAVWCACVAVERPASVQRRRRRRWLWCRVQEVVWEAPGGGAVCRWWWRRPGWWMKGGRRGGA
eukprot:365896-Chlamydomonas_euryale.AAC.16